MVYQMPYPSKQQVFVASSAPTEEQAQQELIHWASGHGFRLAPTGRTFTTYHNGCPQDWLLLEREKS